MNIFHKEKICSFAAQFYIMGEFPGSIVGEKFVQGIFLRADFPQEKFRWVNFVLKEIAMRGGILKVKFSEEGKGRSLV